MVSNQFNSNVLKLLLWNANGIKQNEAKFLNLLQEKQIALALISETHCNTCTKLFFPGYIIYRTDDPDKTAHAGSAIIISSKIKHHLLPASAYYHRQLTFKKKVPFNQLLHFLGDRLGFKIEVFMLFGIKILIG